MDPKMNWPPIRKGTLVEFTKNETDVVLQMYWHARMYHSSRMRSSHHFEKYEGISGCRLFHHGEDAHHHGFPKIPTKKPNNSRNDRQVKFPPVPGANKDLKPSLAYPVGNANRKGKPMKSSLSMSYSDFQRIIQLQKPKRQYEKISFTKAVHYSNGLKGYAPASYPEEYYTPRANLNPSDYDIYNNPHIQEQLRLQYEKSGGKDNDVLPWLDIKQAEKAKEAKNAEAVPGTLEGEDLRKDDLDKVNTVMGDEQLQNEAADTEQNVGDASKPTQDAKDQVLVNGEDQAQDNGDIGLQQETDSGHHSPGPDGENQDDQIDNSVALLENHSADIDNDDANIVDGAQESVDKDDDNTPQDTVLADADIEEQGVGEDLVVADDTHGTDTTEQAKTESGQEELLENDQETVENAEVTTDAEEGENKETRDEADVVSDDRPASSEGVTKGEAGSGGVDAAAVDAVEAAMLAATDDLGEDIENVDNDNGANEEVSDEPKDETEGEGNGEDSLGDSENLTNETDVDKKETHEETEP